MIESELAGRRILVTGGSHGIGLEVVRLLAVMGAFAAVVARQQEDIDAALAELQGDGHLGVSLDVADPSGWPAVVEQLASAGELHGVVTAAGIIGPIGPIGTYGLGDFLRTIQVNLLGTALAVHCCLPMLKRTRGNVVTFSGGGGTSPLPRYDAYAASKAAVVRFTENIAEVLGAEGVTVNCVAPGLVATRIHEATLAAGPEAAGPSYFERTKQVVSKGGAPAREAAELVAFLLGSSAHGINGKLISAQWDPWRDPAFRARLAEDGDFATLRRIDAMFFEATEERH